MLRNSRHRCRHSVIALAVGCAVATGTTVFGDGPPSMTREQMLNRVAELESEISQLAAKRSDEAWMTESRAAEIRAIVQDVLTDADTRASMLVGGGVWEDEEGFYLGDGQNFRLRVKGLSQIRYVFNHQSESFDDTSRGGFENTRTQLKFMGHIADPGVTFKVSGDFGTNGGGGDRFTLLDSWVRYSYNENWYVQVGQYKAPGLREESVSTHRQQFVERSLVNSAFTVDRTQGILLGYQNDWLKYRLSFDDGPRADNEPADRFDVEWSFNTRGDIKIAGSWDQYKDFATSEQDDTGLFLGIGFYAGQIESGTMAPTVSMYQATIDATLEVHPFNVFAAFVYRNVDFEETDDLDQYGAVLQVGYQITDKWSAFARYEHGQSDLPSSDDLSVLSVGASKSCFGGKVKATADIGYAFNQVDGFFGGSSDAALTGWRTDPADEDGQIVVRSQFQLRF